MMLKATYILMLAAIAAVPMTLAAGPTTAPTTAPIASIAEQPRVVSVMRINGKETTTYVYDEVRIVDVWVPAEYRTVYDRVWVPPTYSSSSVSVEPGYGGGYYGGSGFGSTGHRGNVSDRGMDRSRGDRTAGSGRNPGISRKPLRNQPPLPPGVAPGTIGSIARNDGRNLPPGVSPYSTNRFAYPVFGSGGGYVSVQSEQVDTEGYWQQVPREEQVSPAHWEQRAERVKTRPGYTVVRDLTQQPAGATTQPAPRTLTDAN